MANPPTSEPPRPNPLVSSAASTGGTHAVDEFRLQMLNKQTASSFLESILCHPMIPSHVANEAFLALSITDPIAPSLKKAILYRAIASELSLRNVSEKTLQTLELMEELDRENGGGPPSETMKAAYCAVAVSCTEAAYSQSEENFLDAFYRIWVRRMFDLEKSSAAVLISEELREVRNIMWEAVKDLEVRELLANNGLEEALERVRFYLEELYEEMVPSDNVKENVMDLGRRRYSGEIPHGLENQNPAGVDDNGLGLLSAVVDEEEMEPVDKFEGNRVDLRNLGGRRNSREVPSGLVNQKFTGIEDNVVEMNIENADDGEKNRLALEEFKERRNLKEMKHADKVEKNRMDLGAFDEKKNLKGVPSGLKNKNSAGVEDREFGRLSAEANVVEEIEPVDETEGNQMDLSEFEVRRNSREVSSCLENQNANGVENTELGCPSKEMNLQDSRNASLKRKVGLPSHSKTGTENSNTEGNETGILLNKETSCTKETGEKQNELNASGPVSIADRDPDIALNEVENGSVKNNVGGIPRFGLMDKNPTAHTLEWSESPPRADRFHLASPRREVGSPLKLIDDKNYANNNNAKRRKIKKWTPVEEEALIKAVKELGKGCWKAILSKYPDVFEERTEVDLKDKWRNMTRSFGPF